MQNEVFQNISKIIERDSKATTYKLALLRGVIDIIQDNSPFVYEIGERVYFPTGLMIEKWLMYYYPILESSIHIPQINGSSKLAFGNHLLKIIKAYQFKDGGFSAFYNDLKRKEIPDHLQEDFLLLARSMRNTITNMPMRYIGRSLTNEYYSIFRFNNKNTGIDASSIGSEFLIQNSGTFSIPREYYEAFKFLGTFISGQDSLLFKWAEFSVRASGNTLEVTDVLNQILKSPIIDRDVLNSKQLYKDILANDGEVTCVWTGHPVALYDVDHVIPFSVWKNNDLWNLLPASCQANKSKRDKIPSPDQIEISKEHITRYWDLINTKHKVRFQKEMRVSLLGNALDESWRNSGIEQLKTTCRYLINNRGYEEWKSQT